MKELFKKTMARLDELAELKLIDRDRGQLEYFGGDRPAVNFPCALIKVDITKTTNLTATKQMCEVVVTVRVAFDYTGETSNHTNVNRLNKALEFYDTTDKVAFHLQGFGDDEMSAFSRTNQIEEKRRDGLNVVAIGFKTSYVQDLIA